MAEGSRLREGSRIERCVVGDRLQRVRRHYCIEQALGPGDHQGLEVLSYAVLVGDEAKGF